ncbi:MAG: sulfatase-like hydrolase/transferase, partial [Desulfosalsimonadaceae bacterium]|nr:sulfatase-like hydrolase/transferase [Desulfosalsimonadaceae bacterium]
VALEGYEQFFANDDGSNIPMAPPVLYKKFNRTSFWNENGKEVTKLPKDFYATNYIMDKAIDMLKDRPKDKPFYLNISFTAVHFPIQAPENVIQKYIPTYIKGWDIIRKERFERQKELGFFPYDYVLPQRDDVPRWDSLNEQEKQVAFSLLVPIEAKKMAVYAAMLDIVDQNIGRLINYLKENGEYENTVFFFMSDNGASDRDPAVDKHYHMVEWIQAKFDNSLKSIGSKHSFTGLSKGWAMAANTPFNRYKATMYEGGVHTVAFAYYPKLNVSGKRSNCVTSIMDIAPTILDLAGVKYPETYKGKPLTPMQGVSFASLIKDPSDSVGCDKNRYIGWEFVGIKGLRQGNWKLSQEAFDNEFNMFNLSKDPFEEVDLSQKMPERFQQMKNVYKQYREENGVIDVPNSGGGGG